MPAVSLTRSYDDLLSSTLDKVRPKLEDIASTANKAFFFLKKKGNSWEGTDNLGARFSEPVMYSFPRARVYSGYDDLDVTPHDGITRAWFDWAQIAIPITISRIEERQNSGSEVQILNLLEEKINQSMLGMEDTFAKAFLQGQGANGGSTAAQYVDPDTGRSFFLPLGLLIKKDPTSGTVAEIPATETKWRNQVASSTGSTYAGVLKEVRNFYTTCSKGPGGGPDLGLVDEATFNFFEAALAAAHQNPSYRDADIPYDNYRLKGATVLWDEFVPNAEDESATLSTTKGSLYYINSKFFGVKYDSQTNFLTTKFQKPENQDAKTAHIMWYGLSRTNNRRKLGVMYGVDTTIAS